MGRIKDLFRIPTRVSKLEDDINRLYRAIEESKHPPDRDDGRDEGKIKPGVLDEAFYFEDELAAMDTGKGGKA